jgi:cephalosporin hydroxylase
MNLYQYFLDNRGSIIHKSAHYFPIYERHFGPYVGRPLTMIEIGTGRGGSAKMWARYFGPFARVVSIDVDPACRAFEDDQVRVRIGDQSDEAFLASVLGEFGAPDIVVDDGSHMMSHMIRTFEFLYPRISQLDFPHFRTLHRRLSHGPEDVL